MISATWTLRVLQQTAESELVGELSATKLEESSAPLYQHGARIHKANVKRAANLHNFIVKAFAEHKIDEQIPSLYAVKKQTKISNGVNCARIRYPEPAGLFNSPMRMCFRVRMCIVVCVCCTICIILNFDVYLSDLQVLEIWDFRSTARSRQAK
jgi:hypothetical protein